MLPGVWCREQVGARHARRGPNDGGRGFARLRRLAREFPPFAAAGAEGTFQAIRTAIPNCEDWPIIVGEARMTFMNTWNEVRDECPDFTTIAVVNPPGVGASGLRVAYELLQGKEVDESQLGGRFGNTLYVPIPGTITDENFEDEYAKVEGRSTSYTLDGFITQEEAAAFMK